MRFQWVKENVSSVSLVSFFAGGRFGRQGSGIYVAYHMRPTYTRRADRPRRGIARFVPWRRPNREEAGGAPARRENAGGVANLPRHRRMDGVGPLVRQSSDEIAATFPAVNFSAPWQVCGCWIWNDQEPQSQRPTVRYRALSS